MTTFGWPRVLLWCALAIFIGLATGLANLPLHAAVGG